MMSEICWSFENYIPRLCIFVSILSYILLGNTLNAEKVYIVTAYFNVLRQTLYRMFPLSKPRLIFVFRDLNFANKIIHVIYKSNF